AALTPAVHLGREAPRRTRGGRVWTPESRVRSRECRPSVVAARARALEDTSGAEAQQRRRSRQRACVTQRIRRLPAPRVRKVDAAADTDGDRRTEPSRARPSLRRVQRASLLRRAARPAAALVRLLKRPHASG